MRSRRIFWFGMHKVLKRTELQRLRDLGHEVFNPAYISPVYDQSADRRIDIDQPTTLPPEVFATLLAHDFFYTTVPPHIAELLNEYFDVVIVTINVDWLVSLLAAFKGQVVWRVYGQPYSMSQEIINRRSWSALVERDGFSIVPFAAESVENEHRWFLDLCATTVPYQIPDDTFAMSGTWAGARRRAEIAVSIPNIEHPYYRAVYDSFAASFPGQTFRIFGPQRSTPSDRRIVGGLDRREFLVRLAATAGYIYPYNDWVCYLPPIEMMELGGPVLYAPGSLLSRFYGAETPGQYRDKATADKKIASLVSGDAGFVQELLAAQECVRARYDRKVVRPIFDEVFNRLLGPGRQRGPLLTRDGSTIRTGAAQRKLVPSRTVAVMLHVDGLLDLSKGRPYAFEGIPRVVGVIVSTLVEYTDLGIVVTCTESASTVFYDFFQDAIKLGRLELRVVPLGGHGEELQARMQRLWLIEDLNADRSLVGVLVPHYYLFPEALLLTCPIWMYLPDYFPHLMPSVVFSTSAMQDAENKKVGVAIAKKCDAILTNSQFTREYLPDAGFVAREMLDKVFVSPLPLLGEKHGRTLDAFEQSELEMRIAGRPFLFYPTANRPNKQIAFLLKVFAAARLLHPDLTLVLTCDLKSVPGVSEYADQAGLGPHLIIFSRIGDEMLGWLYRNAAALCMTTTLEGNFPPQLLEALSYGTPIVTTRLAMIMELLGDRAEDLQLCEPLDLTEFCAKLQHVLSRPQQVRESQRRVWSYLQHISSREKFSIVLLDILDRLSSLKKAA